MDKSQKVGVKNRSHSTVIYSLPSLPEIAFAVSLREKLTLAC